LEYLFYLQILGLKGRPALIQINGNGSDELAATAFSRRRRQDAIVEITRRREVAIIDGNDKSSLAKAHNEGARFLSR